MTSQIRKTDVSLEGLLNVLGENLYSTPIVAIRELIQNAHDACVRRRVEANWRGLPTIHISTDSARAVITISDNGSGLTKQEIISYLATIGDGYTRKMRHDQKNQDAIGYFGLGFLSVFVVADRVEFITTSFQDNQAGWRYASKDGQRYTLDAVKPRDTGSSVVLHLKDDYSLLADSDFINDIVKKYCCLLDIDILINASTQAANRIEIPWKLPADTPAVRKKKAGLSFASLFDSHFEPILTIPIEPNDACPVHGIIWIQDGSFYVNSDNRIASVFIRSMHITDDAKDLLPAWAGFAGCVIDTPMLTPTASRETIQLNDAFNTLQNHIKNTLITALADIANKKDANWRRIMARHNDNLLGAAVSDETLFDAMQHQLTLPTSEGELMVSEILQHNKPNTSAPDNSGDTEQKTIYMTLEINNSHESLIFKSLGIPVVYGFRYAVGAFCKRLKQKSGIKTVVLGSSDATDAIFPEADIDATSKALLLAHFADSHSKTIISAFEPDCLPLIIAPDQDALLKKRIESDRMDKLVGSAALMMARQFTETLDVACEYYQYINYNNPLIRQFPGYDKNKQQTVANLIKTIASLLGSAEQQHNITLFESLNRDLQQLL